ncbi:F-box/LRR-repeat protein 3-like isoform X2 [Neltuma alba]|uniref:F-box/LRR-repeat protein 3-like isoform X2 n=1 Tax=Neltuma alba TaxID=207710 RepID=UPI0010A3A522|nr:F-box/LRR-repeat protein 3-like isoform X2 [Prosopis alba]XP_028780937.1 F-box/LRR-repeat protein 3 isoform X2 [Prosopis alba]XP_028793546.1 F-box/LRR-repeat protein 3-like isoform X2 [Prosopis alba]
MLRLLTEDLLMRVLDKLSSNADRKSWRLVCKEFLRLELLTRRKVRILRIEFLLGLLRKYCNIEALDLSVCPRIDDGAVSVLLSHGSLNWTKGLRRLVLCRATGLGYRGLELLIRACPLLEAIDVSHCWGFGDREAAVLSYATRLTELKMDKCLGVTDVGLARIAVDCSNLKSLSLKWCFEISDLGIDLLCKKCLVLEMLDISYLKLTSESLKSIASLSKLELLVMVGCSFVDDVGLRFLEKGCPLLKAIDVSRCDFVSSSALTAIVGGHSSLVQIDAGYCLVELSLSLVECMKNLKNLTVVRIDGVQVSDLALQIIGTSCKSLLEIGLSKCVGVTDTGITQLVCGCDSCPHLVCLKLESCNMVTEESFYDLGSRCLLLEELDLTECSGINDRALKYLSRCSKLLTLKLGLCTNISDVGLAYIGCNFPKLVELDLYRCACIGDDGLAALATGCKLLINLNVSYCNRITDGGMEYISYLGELYELEMRGLVNITSIGIRKVAVNCKRLADLDLKHCEKIGDPGFWAIAFYSHNLRQINISYCAVSDVVLCLLMGNLKRLQEVKLVNISEATVRGLELGLRASCGRIKKVKLQASLRFLLSSEILDILHLRGCKIRWD